MLGRPFRGDQAKEHRLRITSCAIRHLNGGIGWEDGDACAYTPAIVDDLKRAPTEHWRNAPRDDGGRMSQREHQQDEVDDGKSDEESRNFHKLFSCAKSVYSQG